MTPTATLLVAFAIMLGYMVPFIFLMLIERYAFMTALTALAIIVNGGSWPWLFVLIIAAGLGIRGARRDARLLAMTPEERWRYKMENAS